jgi:hypothetical protein
MGATRRYLQAQTKILKNLSEHQIYQSKQKNSQMGSTRRNLLARPKFKKKIIITSNQPIKTKILPKKHMFCIFKV